MSEELNQNVQKIDQDETQSYRELLLGEHVMGLIAQGNSLSDRALRSALWVTAQNSTDPQRKNTATDLLKTLSIRS